MRRRRPLAAAPFAAALLAFLLPFGTVSCGPLTTEVSGAQLVARQKPEVRCEPAKLEPGESCRDRGGGDLGALVLQVGGGLATALFAAAAVGLLFARGGRPGAAAAAGIGALAAGIALGLRRDVYGQEGDPIVSVDARPGYWLVLGFLALGTLGVLTTWWRAGRALPSRRVLPALLGVTLLWLGYIFPNREGIADAAYVDSLDVQRLWLALDPGLLVAVSMAAILVRAGRLRPSTTGVLFAIALVSLVGFLHEGLTASRIPGEIAHAGTGLLLCAVGAALVAGWSGFLARNLQRAGVFAPYLLSRGVAIAGGVAFVTASWMPLAGAVDPYALDIAGLDSVPAEGVAAGLATLAVISLGSRLPTALARGLLLGTAAQGAAFFLGFLAPLHVDAPDFQVGLGTWLGLAGAVLVAASARLAR